VLWYGVKPSLISPMQSGRIGKEIIGHRIDLEWKHKGDTSMYEKRWFSGLSK